jgi:hypothetical protein
VSGRHVRGGRVRYLNSPPDPWLCAAHGTCDEPTYNAARFLSLYTKVTIPETRLMSLADFVPDCF